MVDARDPFAPQVGTPPLDGDEREHADHYHDDESARKQGDRLVEGNGAPGQLAEHFSSPARPRPDWSRLSGQDRPTTSDGESGRTSRRRPSGKCTAPARRFAWRARYSFPA